MRYHIAMAFYLGNKIHYFRTNDQLSRVIVGTHEEPLFFETVEEMFKDWQRVEDLVIYDESLKLEFKKYERRP
jgi:hypothetical protein